MKVNYHTHTPRCHHAVGDEREYIENAIRAGFEVLGFSDHSPQFFKNGYVSAVRMLPSEAYEYVYKVKELGYEYREYIDIKVGFEAEYFPAVFNTLVDFGKELEIDYMILGQHSLIDEAYDNWSSTPDDSEDKLTLYVNQVIKGLQTGHFTYLAHPDMINFTGDENWFNTEMTRLCVEAKRLDIPLEFNMLGLMTNRHYPSERFYKLAKAVGNEIIIGCDAHQPDALSNLDMQEKCREWVVSRGLTLIPDVKRLLK